MRLWNIKLLRWKSKFAIRHFNSAFIFYATISLLRVTFLDNGKITVVLFFFVKNVSFDVRTSVNSPCTLNSKAARPNFLFFKRLSKDSFAFHRAIFVL